MGSYAKMPLVLVAILFAPVVPARGDELDPEVKALQGQWEMQVQQDGKQFKVVKEVKDYRETVRTYHNGQLIQQHVVDFELERAAGVRIFRWKNGLFVVGPRQGQKLPDGSFVYRLHNDQWTGVFGLIDDNQGPVFAEVYRRVKPVEQ